MHSQTSFLKIILLTFCTLALWLCSVQLVQAATLSISPGTGVYTSGSTFTAQVIVNTQGSAINAAEGTLTFNPQELSVVGIAKGSIFSLWAVEPSYSNSAGTVSFGGGSPSGYTGAGGTILSVTFRAKGSGASKVSFKNGSVLAADGRGTNVLNTMNGGTFTIAAADVAPEPEVIEYVAQANTPGTPVITSSTHTDQAGWSSQTTAKLSWSIPDDVSAIRTLLNDSSGSIPTKVYEPAVSSIELPDLEEGVQYFHLQFRNAEGWGRVAHYRLAVDTKPPENFSIKPLPDADLSNPAQQFLLDIQDEGSGIAYFVVQIDGGDPYQYEDSTGSSTIALPELPPGHHSLVIEAFDKAGNSLIATHSFNILAFDKPQFTEYPSEINEEVIPVIKGVTRANSEVTITLKKQNTASQDQTYTVMSDQSGEFIFIPEGTLTLGVYTIGATAIDAYGAQSDPADEIKIAVQQPGYLAIGSFVVSVLSVIVPLVGLLVLLVLLLLYSMNRFRGMKAGVLRESHEAVAIVEKEFTALLKNLEQQKVVLEKSRKTKKITKAEEALLSETAQALRNAQKTITKEIEDVDAVIT